MKCVTDKVYGRTRHLWPLHAALELHLMGPEEQEAVEEDDAWNKGPRNSVEMTFNMVQKFTHTRNRIFAGCLLQLAIQAAVRLHNCIMNTEKLCYAAYESLKMHFLE